MRDSIPGFGHTARRALAVAAAAAALVAWTAGPDAAPARGQEAADTAVVEEVSVRVGPGSAGLAAELSDGTRTEVALEDGEVLVDGEARADYPDGGELESAWREFLRDRVDPAGTKLAAALRGWSPPAGADSAAARALGAAVSRLAAAAERGGPAPGAADTAAGAEEPPEIAGQETRVVPPDRPLEEFSGRLERLRDALDRIGRGAVGALGDAALVVHDDYEIEAGRTVEGDVALLSGELDVAGTVNGDLLVLEGELTLEEGSSVEGDVLQVGGTVTNRGGSIGGDLVSVGGEEAITRDMEESVGEPSSPAEPGEDWWEERYGPDRGIGYQIWDNVRDGFGGLFTTLSFFLVLAVLGAVPIYFAREKFETTVRTVRHSFGRSFLLGLAGQVLYVPALVVLTVGILTIPLIPVFVLAVALAAVLGYLTVAYAAGEMIRDRGHAWLERFGSGPYRTLILGLAALLLLFAVLSLLEFFGDMAEPLRVMTLLGALTISWVAFTAGFGAVALSYAGVRDDYATPGGPGGGGGGGGGGGEPPVPAPGGETPPPGPETAAPAPGEGTGNRPPEEDVPAPGDGGRDEPDRPPADGEAGGGEDRRG